MQGAIAAGHTETVDAAASVLADGGNAFDAVLAALGTAFVAEPVLASPAGGGFLLAKPADWDPRVYDFFVQTPSTRRSAADIDFYPIAADFGTTTQEFHIGLGAVAVPGVVRGMFDVHGELCTMPMEELLRPAIELARKGVLMTRFQAELLQIVAPSFTATSEIRAIFDSPSRPGQLVGEGERLVLPELADSLEALASEGADLFYRGEIAAAILEAQAAAGGQLTAHDLASYEVAARAPLSVRYGDATIHTNPPPASGGLLLAFGLELLAGRALEPARPPEPTSLEQLVRVMEATQEARIAAVGVGEGLGEGLLDPGLLERYRARVLGRLRSRRGTTHISVVDHEGNLASLTVSNGEGCGHVIPGTGIVLNNMLGEEDLNPGGFGRWPTGHRMTSMMAPTLVEWPDGRRCALGSGGSNRIRTAILQVVLDLCDRGLSLQEAIDLPRVHLEGRLLSVEGGYERAIVRPLEDWFDVHYWDERSMFFGGVHAVLVDGDRYEAVADARRDGASRLL